MISDFTQLSLEEELCGAAWSAMGGIQDGTQISMVVPLWAVYMLNAPACGTWP